MFSCRRQSYKIQEYYVSGVNREKDNRSDSQIGAVSRDGDSEHSPAGGREGAVGDLRGQQEGGDTGMLHEDAMGYNAGGTGESAQIGGAVPRPIMRPSAVAAGDHTPPRPPAPAGAARTPDEDQASRPPDESSSAESVASHHVQENVVKAAGAAHMSLHGVPSVHAVNKKRAKPKKNEASEGGGDSPASSPGPSHGGSYTRLLPSRERREEDTQKGAKVLALQTTTRITIQGAIKLVPAMVIH